MLFTTKTEYGLKSLEILAKYSQDQAVSLPDIAKQTGLSLSYLEQIFAKLKRGKIIKSTKGAEGGYVLARPGDKITLWEIIKVLEGRTAVNNCMADAKKACRGRCLTRRVWLDIQNELEKKLKHYKLQDIIS